MAAGGARFYLEAFTAHPKLGDDLRFPNRYNAACQAARAGAEAVGKGPVGAGAGATVGKWEGPGRGRPAGLGSAVARHDGVTVAALVVANAVGDLSGPPGGPPRVFDPGAAPVSTGEATTIGLVVTDAGLTKAQCRLVAESAHDGLARAIDPVHTAADGDAFIAAATGQVPASVHAVRSLATWVVEEAVRDALR